MKHEITVSRRHSVKRSYVYPRLILTPAYSTTHWIVDNASTVCAMTFTIY